MKKPRMTDEDRLRIEDGLRARLTLYEIARRLNRPVSTISREIRLHTQDCNKGAACRVTNRCTRRTICNKYKICADCLYDSNRKCSLCRRCNENCKDFKEEVCERLEHAPYVCNGCLKEHGCVLRKKFYSHQAAQREYKTLQSEARSGVNISQEELLDMDTLLMKLVAQGQSVHAAMVNNKEHFNCSEKTVYRLANAGLLHVKRIDMPRAYKLKVRKAKSIEHKVDKKCRINRTYDDYRLFMEAHPGLRVTQMDTVEGTQGGKVLLTLMFCPFGFMSAFILERKSSACVSAVFADIRKRLIATLGAEQGNQIFGELFPVILTDNGTEFSDPHKLEFNEEELKLTSVYYCNSYSSYEKGAIERNHVEVRRIVPKGSTYFEATSFNDLTQAKISLMMSHINSYPRKSLKDKTPYELFTAAYGEEVAAIFGITRIAPNEVTLRPSLLGIKVTVKKEYLDED